MLRCPNCGGYTYDSQNGCSRPDCGHKPSTPRPPAWWGTPHFSKHGAGSREQEGNRGDSASTHRQTGATTFIQVHECPECRHQSLFWRKTERRYHCVNSECGRFFAEYEVNIVRYAAEDYHRCKNCGLNSATWNQSLHHYQCHNVICHAQLPPDEK